MLTRSEVHEAEAEANSHEAEAIIALFFSAKFYIWPHFLQTKREIFGWFSTGLQKFWLKLGFSMKTLLANIPKPTSYVFGCRLLLLCLHTE